MAKHNDYDFGVVTATEDSPKNRVIKALEQLADEYHSIAADKATRNGDMYQIHRLMTKSMQYRRAADSARRDSYDLD